MRWFKKSGKKPGWMVLDIDEGKLNFVHGKFVPAGRSEIIQCGTHVMDGAGLAKLSKDLGLSNYDCATILHPGTYQALLVEAPNVPRDELKAAIRWRIKDMIDYHVDDATVDVLDVPVPDDTSGRNHSMYAIAARNEAVQACVARFNEAGIGLSVIDIPETAQRNIANLYQDADRGTALLYFDADGGLLTISFADELHLARRLDITHAQIVSGGSEVVGRVVLEIQRSLDHFERQFSYISVSKLLLGPEPVETPLLEAMKQGLGIAVIQVDLDEVLDFAAQPASREDQWKLFHLIGASLRHEAKVL